MIPEKVLLRAVIVFPLRGRKVLLAKKVGKIGAGCWNGYGGGIESGETAVDAAIRELFEESRLRARADDLEKVAVIAFHNQKTDGTFFTCECHVFVLRTFQG